MSATPFRLLIRQARILLPTGDFLVGDVGIRDREIVRVAPDLNSAAGEVLDAEGLTLLPGVIDPPGAFPRTRSIMAFLSGQRQLVRPLCSP